jgi:hypothetical protein
MTVVRQHVSRHAMATYTDEELGRMVRGHCRTWTEEDDLELLIIAGRFPLGRVAEMWDAMEEACETRGCEALSFLPDAPVMERY